MVTGSGATHPGRTRQINEDVFLCDPDMGLFVVADGMGGHNAGEVASRLAVESIRGFLVRTRGDESVTWPYGIDPKLSFDSNRLLTAVKLANRRVFKAAESHDDYTGMGTTVVCVLVAADRLIFASVGDSRLYSLRDGRDDTWIALIMSEGRFDPTRIATHPMKHVLTNVIGAREQVECRVHEQLLEREETFLLSSDGGHGALDDDALSAIMAADAPPETLAQRLVTEALQRGGDDNLTAVVVRYRP
jgi:protein phosphatase